MSALSGRCAKERRVIDVNAVRGDLFAAQLEHVGERHRDGRAIMARIGHCALAGNRGALTVGPRAQHSVPARGYRCEKPRRGGTNRLGTDDRRGIAEPELRIGSKMFNECRRIASVDGRKQPLPPSLVRLKDMLCCDCHLQSILDPISTCLIKDR